ncbi:CHASE domain-containing protein [Marinobacterium weihaiense]|uniref:CHASE domain-containing protein n=1 Tax=Marinobacterium weihaiense TaxID=2851016 RepID=A0ABS6M900_9GAMM|nr:CHASE domain-containing protein [Marinobacterium weihaiense]MBV0932754.1 CHASE domain-containing protein [Marinobacterium weihaiense]
MKPAAPSMSIISANLLLALGYMLMGLACSYTGMHEQIAPLWLPAGLALAALLRSGCKLLPGVALGSLSVNLAIPALQGPLAPHHVYAALVIASGAVVQGWMAMCLLQRLGADPLKPVRERWMTPFVLYSGVVVCLVNASLGTLAVTVFNQGGSTADMLENGVSWWLGDSFGVLLGTPLFLAIADAKRQRAQLNLAARLLGVLLAVVLVNQYYLLHLNGVLKQSFAQDTQLLDARIQAIIQQNLRDLSRIGQSLGKEPDVTAHVFREQVEPLMADNPALRAYSWDPLIQSHQRADFEAQTRQQLQWPEYQVYGESPTDRPTLIPVQFVEPLATNRAALGFNLYSMPDRRRWVELAQARGEAVATEVLYLTQAPDEPGLLVMQPVYRLVGNDLLNSRRELRGFVVGVFTVSRLLDAAQVSTDGRLIGLRVSEAGEEPFYDTWLVKGDNDRKGLRQAFSVQLAQQEWQIDARAGPDYLSTHPVSQAQYLQILLVGVSALGVLLILAMHHRERLLEARVRQQTEDLAWQALHDDLTRLQNRKGLKQRLE